MNKGLLIHIIVAIVFHAMVLFIIGDRKTNTDERFIICFFFFMYQIATAIFNATEEFYKEKY